MPGGTRSRFRSWFFLPLLGGLLLIAAATLIPSAERRLADTLGKLLRNGLGLVPASLEVNLPAGLAVARDLRPTPGFAMVRRVEEIRLEGVNLFALVFGTEDARLADHFLLRGVEPMHSNAGLALERLEVHELSGPFPGLLSLPWEPRGEAFGPDALRMRAKVVDLTGLRLHDPGLDLALDALSGVGFSLARHELLLLDGLRYEADGLRFGAAHLLSGARRGLNLLPYFESPAGGGEATRLPAGVRLNFLALRAEAAYPTGGAWRAALLSGALFSGPESARVVLAVRGLTALDWIAADFLPPADGRLAGEAQAESGAGAGGFRLTVQGELRNPAGEKARLLWEQADEPPPPNAPGLFPALELRTPKLLAASLDFENRGRPHSTFARWTFRLLQQGMREAPGLFTPAWQAEISTFSREGGGLCLSLEPTRPTPLLFIPNLLLDGSPDIGAGLSRSAPGT